jgi:murein DD-endopeptidase MepM/ murein hydrolase activator NlpD
LASSTPIPPERVSPSPAFIENTPVPLPEGLSIGEFSNPLAEQNPEKFQLPPEQVPLSLHPFDHYYLTRPIDVTANSQYLFYYPYGSSGSQGWRVHHGLDMPNVVGEEVQAAGPGTVVWADRAYETELDGDLEVYAAYGNVVVIEHDFSWRGQKVWTLYAHLSAITVRAGDKVQTGDIIGLVGVTGDVSGPHVHFEVRLGRNSYYSTRNPLLWMAPYVGHGVVAGRVVDEEGRFIDNVLVQLNRGGRLTDSTTTYSNPYEPNKRLWTVVPDDNWNENFALGDIPAGEYQLVAVVEDRRYFQTVQVNAGMTSFVEIQIGGIATPIPVQATAIIPTPLPTAIPLSPTP